MGTSHFRTSAGVGLHVEADGPDSAPMTLVLAHGWTLDSRSWEPVARALTREGSQPVRVLRYDHRGHGRSQSVSREEMTIDALADDLADLIADRVPSGPVVIAGHSMGGMTAMALAERHPQLTKDRVAGVALVSTASGGLADTTLGLSVRMLGLVRKAEARLAESERFDRRQVLSRRAKPLEPAVRWLLVGKGADAGARELSARCLAGCRPSTMVGFRPTLDQHERDEALKVFDGIPIEVLVGSRDKLTPVASSERIVAHAPSARLTVYPRAGHMLPLERVRGVADQLAELCASAAAVKPAQPADRAPAGSPPALATPDST